MTTFLSIAQRIIIRCLVLNTSPFTKNFIIWNTLWIVFSLSSCQSEKDKFIYNLTSNSDKIWIFERATFNRWEGVYGSGMILGDVVYWFKKDGALKIGRIDKKNKVISISSFDDGCTPFVSYWKYKSNKGIEINFEYRRVLFLNSDSLVLLSSHYTDTNFFSAFNENLNDYQVRE